MSTGGRSLKRSLAMVSGGAEPMIMRAPSLRRVETVNRKIKKAIERTKEKKFLDTLVHNATQITTTAVVTKLSAVAQGVGDSQRVGDALTATGVEYRQLCSYQDAGCIRHVVFQWKADDTTAPVVGDILDLGVITTAFNAPYNHDKRNQFRILDDYRAFGDNSGEGATGVTKRLFGKKISKDIRYLAAGTTGFNQIYMISVSSVSGAANPPSVTVGARITFTDS